MRIRAAGALWWSILVAFLIWFGSAQATDRYWITLGITALWTATAVIGLNVLLGSTGLISLGHYAFVVIGGFAGTIWAVEDLGLSPWLGFPFAFVVGAVLGAVLAFTCCHLHGFYLTVVTLAFGLVASAFALLFDDTFNGLSGRSVSEPLDTSFSFIDAANPNRPFVGLYWIGVVLLLFSLYLTQNLLRSRWGRAYRAIRESELAAQACGVNSYWYKVSAFALSAGITALAGVLAAQYSLQVTMLEGTATVGESFRFVVYALVGGIATLGGPVVGTFIFTLAFGIDIGGKSITEWLVLDGKNYEPAFLAALVLGLMIVAPDGVIGALTRGAHVVCARFGRSRAIRLEPSEPTITEDATLIRPRVASTIADATPILELRGIGLKFGGLSALRDIDLTVERGTVQALIGPNGSGKSTLVNVVAGVYRPDEGTVRFRGRSIGKLPIHRRSRLGIARTFQNLQIWRNMTVLENVMVGAHPSTRVDLARSVLLPRWMRPEERRVRDSGITLLQLVGLSERAHQVAGTLTNSEQHRLEIARALASRPELLVLDEPAAGMTAVEARELISLIERIRAAGITVLLIDHRMEVVMGLADRVTVLNFGETIADGSPDEVRNDPLVVAAYLGKHAPSDLVVRVVDEPAPELVAATPPDPAPAVEREAMLAVRGLEVHYGGIRALRGIDLDVYEGEVVALIGANGAGKSTSLKTVSGMSELFKSVRGEVTYLGERIDQRAAHHIARMGIAHVPEGRRVFTESTVEENLLLGGYRRRESAVRREFDAIYDRFPSLGRRRDRLAGMLSGGEQQMLAVARALASKPRFLMLDEPSLGLAPITADQVFQIVRGLADDGVTVLVVEQAATNALSIADRAYVLEIGVVVAEGPAAALIDDPEVKAAYLGD